MPDVKMQEKTWRDFAFHIATTMIGLLLALGFNSIVDQIVHRKQLKQLQAQLHDVLEADLTIDQFDRIQLQELRQYLVDERNARHKGRAAERTIQRPKIEPVRIPGLASYESAKENGTVALLSTDDLRLYNRLELQRQFLLEAVEEWMRSIKELEAFTERFEDDQGSILFGTGLPDLNKGTLDLPSSKQYDMLLAALIKDTDRFEVRVDYFDKQCLYVLTNGHDEGVLFVKDHASK